MNANPQVSAPAVAETAVKLKLKPHGLQSLRNAREQALGRRIPDRELADMLGVNQSNLSRVLKETADPGIPFVAGCLNVFGVFSVDCLFDIVPDPTRNGRREQSE